MFYFCVVGRVVHITLNGLLYSSFSLCTTKIPMVFNHLVIFLARSLGICYPPGVKMRYLACCRARVGIVWFWESFKTKTRIILFLHHHVQKYTSIVWTPLVAGECFSVMLLIPYHLPPCIILCATVFWALRIPVFGCCIALTHSVRR